MRGREKQREKEGGTVAEREGKSPLGRPRRRWLHNIRVDLVEVGWDDVVWLRIGTGGELL
jgi:hypothetical protein